MTEQMAIEKAIRCVIGVCDETCSGYSIKDGCCVGYKEITKGLERELVEIQQYRAIGTVEDIQLIFSLCKDLEKMLKKYESIGTVEELQALKEKSVVKPTVEPFYGGRCTCGTVIGNKSVKYCHKCGAKFDWE